MSAASNTHDDNLLTSTRTYSRMEESDAPTTGEIEAAHVVRPSERVIDYVADPDQLVTNHRLLGVLGGLVVIVLVQAAFNLVLYLRRPDMIVVDRTAGGDRVVVMNNRAYGLSDGVQLKRAELTDGDKKYLATVFLGLYYGNNPDYRDQQLNEAIGLMVAARGREMFNYLKQNHVLEQQAAESWQAKWTQQQVSVDPSDPFTVHVIGVQNLTRIVNQRPVEEAHQLNVTVKLAKDELGRDERNKRTGYQVTWFGWEELKNPTAATDSSAPPERTPTVAPSDNTRAAG
jgi:hypothetical protein